MAEFWKQNCRTLASVRSYSMIGQGVTVSWQVLWWTPYHRSGFKPKRVILWCSWGRVFPLTVPLSTQGCKWVIENFQGKVTHFQEVNCGEEQTSFQGLFTVIQVVWCSWNQSNVNRIGQCSNFWCWVYNPQVESTQAIIAVLNGRFWPSESVTRINSSSAPFPCNLSM